MHRGDAAASPWIIESLHSFLWGTDDISIVHLGFILGAHTLEFVYPHNTQGSLL